ncbi:o-succinylbenzoate--CoA ligase [Chlorobium sp. N1]|uniref:o-succinylbenzoate--CoA ligase n=1 Tax=Chlorobium sp. N1 TaxID=2491138 RepID=UPI00103E88D5|nr:o-succinylbenzoate--CoA ligase [Chlorobium sp. N1]TCD47901.1 o-succinylbenzoate--CoA ligase [Chlorobium sp. N1]
MDPLSAPPNDPVAAAASLYRDAPLLRTPDAVLSFEACSQAAGRIASMLLARGLEKGDRVAVVSTGTPESVLLLLALLRAGMVAAPLNHRLPEARLRQMLEALRPALTLTGEGSPLEMDAAAETEDIVRLMAESRGFDHALPDPGPADRPATLIHTSASTGPAKAAVHSLENHWYNALGSNLNIPFGRGDTWLLSLPLFHVGGYAPIFRALASGGALALDRQGTPLPHTLERFLPTHLSLVPTQLYRLIESGRGQEEAKGIRAILLGGSAASTRLVDEAARKGLPVYLSYGSTEMGSQIATTPGPVRGAREDSGQVLRWRELRRAPDGELLVRGRCLFSGYLRGEEVDPCRDARGWFHTGDMGRILEDGSVVVEGRKDGMFISGGENIHPEEIERELTAVEGVRAAVVAPIPDPEYGERAAAFIETSPAEGPDEETLRTGMQRRVGRLKTPVVFFRVCQWATLPGSEKIDRAWYRQLAREYRRPESSGGPPCA